MGRRSADGGRPARVGRTGRPLRVGVDVDGTVLRYVTDSQYNHDTRAIGYRTFGELLPGAREGLAALKAIQWCLACGRGRSGHGLCDACGGERHEPTQIVMHTARAERSALLAHLRHVLNLPVDELHGAGDKSACDVYLDDRAVPFEGEWGDGLVRRLVRFRSWEERELGMWWRHCAQECWGQ